MLLLAETVLLPDAHALRGVNQDVQQAMYNFELALLQQGLAAGGEQQGEEAEDDEDRELETEPEAEGTQDLAEADQSPAAEQDAADQQPEDVAPPALLGLRNVYKDGHQAKSFAAPRKHTACVVCYPGKVDGSRAGATAALASHPTPVAMAAALPSFRRLSGQRSILPPGITEMRRPAATPPARAECRLSPASPIPISPRCPHTVSP
ncbi:hypothetical protein V5799_006071 [Amblyomma americanum]|uniref:Uncharacterized protein n=1 Tax=Amblyomma americanum TaxID=6943 RepID=A0AAQ4DXE7_AMBAM